MTGCVHGWLRPEVEMACLDGHEVVLRCGRQASVSVRFAERHAALDRLDGRLFFLVQVRAPGLDARLEGVTNHVVGRGLARFVERLEIEGWEGERLISAPVRRLRHAASDEDGPTRSATTAWIRVG